MADEGVRFLPRLPKRPRSDYRAAAVIPGVDLNVMIRASRPARQALLRLIRFASFACLAIPLMAGACSSTTASGDPIVDASTLEKKTDIKLADEYVIGAGDNLRAC